MSDSIFGGDKAQSSSSNIAYPTLNKDLSGTIAQGTGAGTQMGNLLGLNGTQGQNAGFDNWRRSTGYQFGLKQGEDSITGNAATQGLLNSGATLRAMDTYGQNYADSKYGDYMSQLQGLLGSGLQASGILGSAGQVSSSSEHKQPGMGGFIGSLLGK